MEASSVLLVWILVHISGIGCFECGYPGSPSSGRPHPLKERYSPGEGVSFTCDPGYALHGNPHRTCGQDGTWQGQLPLCDRGLSSVVMYASSRQTLGLYPAEMVVDGDPRTCSYTDKVRPRYIRVDMRADYRVRAVSITVPHAIYSQDAAQLTIYAINVRDSTTATYHKCATFNGRFASPTLRLSCAGGGVEGRYIHVEDNRRRVDYFSLCEIHVFVHKDRYECGEVERPAHAYSVRTDTGAVNYRCLHGYRLEGPDTRICTDSGQWSPEAQPVCAEITCPALSSVPHGRLVHSGIRHVMGATANLTCDFGFESAVRTLVCGDDGKWTPTPDRLSCQPVECGPPPARHPSDQFVLLNGTRYGAVALLSCSSSSADQEPVHCREDGHWSTPKTDCAPQRDSSGLSRLGLIEEDQGDVPTGVVIGMAVVVFLLLLVVILVLLLKRRKVLRQNSADSLPRKEKEQAPPPPASFDNDAFYATIQPSSESDKPRPLFSTVLFPNHWRRRKSGSSSKDSGHSSSSGGCIYEEVGGVKINEADLKNENVGVTIAEGVESRGEAVYAQVDLDEKRRSRLNKTLKGERFEPVDPPQWEGTYRSEEGVVYDEVDLEPIKLRELPPIPGDEGVTYASLALPLDPPPSDTRMKDNELYHASDALKV